MFRIRAFGLDIYGCREALERLDDFVDRELPLDESRRVSQHLKLCRECGRKFRFEADLVAGLKEKIERVEAPQDAQVNALKNRISAMLAQETGPPDKPAAK
jgi:anti-sigma factor RsiW